MRVKVAIASVDQHTSELKAVMQAFRDTLRHRTEDPRREQISLGNYYTCSKFMMQLHILCTAVFFLVMPAAGLLMLPGLVCTMVWILLLRSLSRNNSSGYLVPQRDTESGANSKPAKGLHRSLWFLLGMIPATDGRSSATSQRPRTARQTRRSGGDWA